MAREYPSPVSDESIAVRAVAILRRRALIAAVAFTTVLAAAVAFAVYLPDLYKASAIVVIERPVPEGVVRATVSNELESRLYQIRQEVLSRDRLTGLVKRYNLYPELRRKASFEDVLNQAREDIQWEPNGPEQVSGRTKTVAFTLTYTGTEQRTVADVTNAIAQFFVEHNSAMRAGEARRAVQLLEGQVSAARQQVEMEEARMRNFTLRNQAQLPQAAGVAMASYQSVADELRRNRDEQRRNQEARDKLQEGLEDAAALATAAKGIIATDGHDVPLSKELAEARKALIEAERRGFTGDHPDITTAKSRIATAEKDVQDQRARDLAAFKAQQAADAQRRAVAAAPADLSSLPRSKRSLKDFDDELVRLKTEERDLQQRVAELQQKFDSTPGVEQDYIQYQRNYLAAKENYDVLARRYEEARFAESIETGHQGENFRILDAAIAPEGPSAPNRLRLFLMGLLLALAAMAAMVVAAEQFDTSFHTVDEIRDFTAVPVIATIPQIGRTPRRGWARTTFSTASAAAVVVLVATLSAYLAHGNDTLVRLLQRAG